MQIKLLSYRYYSVLPSGGLPTPSADPKTLNESLEDSNPNRQTLADKYQFPTNVLILQYQKTGFVAYMFQILNNAQLKVYLPFFTCLIIPLCFRKFKMSLPHF